MISCSDIIFSTLQLYKGEQLWDFESEFLITNNKQLLMTFTKWTEDDSIIPSSS